MARFVFQDKSYPPLNPLKFKGHIGESKFPELLCDFFLERRGRESVHLLRQQLDAGGKAEQTKDVFYIFFNIPLLFFLT